MNTGDEILAGNASWTFRGETPKYFDQHVEKSVPLYAEGHVLATKLSDFFLTEGSVCYDLGCSTGSLVAALADRHKQKKIKYLALDSAPEMIDVARKKCSGFDNIMIIQGDLLDMDFEKSDLIISYYTMQFVQPKNRQILFDRIYNALNWGGAFLLFEKVRGADARFQDIMSSLYTDYKLDQGYTAEEIINKSKSLKGVLEPFSESGNLDLLKRAGFVDIMSVMKYICFEGFLAIK